ncbi:hypothetical protein C8R43DRAFT_961783 [Mycena crocata]|nr:hypothetical protein C8R43DRAFT_961783 [Mycena crocata]
MSDMAMNARDHGQIKLFSTDGYVQKRNFVGTYTQDPSRTRPFQIADLKLDGRDPSRRDGPSTRHKAGRFEALLFPTTRLQAKDVYNYRRNPQNFGNASKYLNFNLNPTKGLSVIFCMIYGYFVRNLATPGAFLDLKQAAFGNHSKYQNSGVKTQPGPNGGTTGHRGTAYQSPSAYNPSIPFRASRFRKSPAHSVYLHFNVTATFRRVHAVPARLQVYSVVRRPPPVSPDSRRSGGARIRMGHFPAVHINCVLCAVVHGIRACSEPGPVRISCPSGVCMRRTWRTSARATVGVMRPSRHLLAGTLPKEMALWRKGEGWIAA